MTFSGTRRRRNKWPQLLLLPDDCGKKLPQCSRCYHAQPTSSSSSQCSATPNWKIVPFFSPLPPFFGRLGALPLVCSLFRSNFPRVMFTCGSLKKHPSEGGGESLSSRFSTGIDLGFCVVERFVLKFWGQLGKHISVDCFTGRGVGLSWKHFHKRNEFFS